MIDVALLTGVLLIFSLMVGEIRTESGTEWGFFVYLNPAWWLVYLAVLLAYYFVFEVALGQTIGKRLLGLRVVRADGSRPPVAAIAVRTLLRIVDWLPALYLLGFLAMLASGASGWAILRPRRGWPGRYRRAIAASPWYRWRWLRSCWRCRPTTPASPAPQRGPSTGPGWKTGSVGT